MKQLLEKLPFFQKKKKGPFAVPIKKAKKKIKGLKIKLFLLYTLPVFIVALAKAVIEEYTKIHTRQAAMNVNTALSTEAETSSEPAGPSSNH